MRTWLQRLQRLFTTTGIWALAALLLFEEWGWERLSGVVAWFGRLPGLRWIEARIRALPPKASLALFIVPVLCLLPVKLLALYWLGQGHTVLGIGVIVAAKLGGTALTARLFVLTQASLMQMPWFARWFGQWMVFKTRVLATVRGSAAWQSWLRTQARVHQAWQTATAALLKRWPFS